MKKILTLTLSAVMLSSMNMNAQEVELTYSENGKTYSLCPQDTTGAAELALEEAAMVVDAKAQKKMDKAAKKRAQLETKMANGWNPAKTGAPGLDDFNTSLKLLLDNTIELEKDAKRYKMEVWCTAAEGGETEHLVRFLDITTTPYTAVSPKTFKEYNLKIAARSLEYVNASLALVAGSASLASDVVGAVSDPLLAISVGIGVTETVTVCQLLNMKVKSTDKLIKEQKEMFDTYEREYGATWKETAQ